MKGKYKIDYLNCGKSLFWGIISISIYGIVGFSIKAEWWDLTKLLALFAVFILFTVERR